MGLELLLPAFTEPPVRVDRTVSINIPNSNWRTNSNAVEFNADAGSRISLGSILSADGREMFLDYMQLRTRDGRVRLRFAPDQNISEGLAGPEFSNQMEQKGTIKFTASNGSILTLNGITDTSEPYEWTPSNSAEVQTFARTLRGLGNRALTIEFNDNNSKG